MVTGIFSATASKYLLPIASTKHHSAVAAYAATLPRIEETLYGSLQNQSYGFPSLCVHMIVAFVYNSNTQK